MSIESLDDAEDFAKSSLGLLSALESGKIHFTDAELAHIEHGFLEAARVIKRLRDSEAYRVPAVGHKACADAEILCDIIEQPHGSALLLKLQATRLDATVAEDFKQRMTHYIETGSKKLILDLSNITFLDSRGLRAIIICSKLMGDRNLALVNVSERVTSLLHLSAMDELLSIHADLDSALRCIEAYSAP